MPVPPSGGVVGTRPRIGPEHAEGDLVDGERVAGRETEPDRRVRARQTAQPLGVAGARPAHPRLEDPPDPVPGQQPREPGDVILVRVA